MTFFLGLGFHCWRFFSLQIMMNKLSTFEAHVLKHIDGASNV